MKKLAYLFLILTGLSGIVSAKVTVAEAEAYYDCCYHKEVRSVISEATTHLLEHVKKNQKKEQPEPLAIVFDIDETVISNYHIMRELKFQTNATNFRHHILRGEGKTLQPSLELYQLAKKHKVAVFFVTGRDELLHKVTSENLRAAGFADWDGLFLKPLEYQEKSIVPFKSDSRSKIEKMGYRIVASIGDQVSDYEGGYNLKGFKLPNPYYHIS